MDMKSDDIKLDKPTTDVKKKKEKKYSINEKLTSGSAWVLMVYMFIWIGGIVLAKGMWSTFFAICTGGLWSAYLLIEQLFKLLKFI